MFEIKKIAILERVIEMPVIKWAMVLVSGVCVWKCHANFCYLKRVTCVIKGRLTCSMFIFGVTLKLNIHGTPVVYCVQMCCF